MARLHQGVHYSDTREELIEYKAYRQGALDDAFWDEDELVDHVPGSKAKKRYKGCKGNNNGEHIYVWIPWTWSLAIIPVYEESVCCGCDRRKRGKNSFRRIR